MRRHFSGRGMSCCRRANLDPRNALTDTTIPANLTLLGIPLPEIRAAARRQFRPSLKGRVDAPLSDPRHCPHPQHDAIDFVDVAIDARARGFAGGDQHFDGSDGGFYPGNVRFHFGFGGAQFRQARLDRVAIAERGADFAGGVRKIIVMRKIGGGRGYPLPLRAFATFTIDCPAPRPPARRPAHRFE
jgi:hypothetical protein